MKKLFLLFIATIFTYSTYAQVPEMFNYQAVVRNDNGEVLMKQQVHFRLSILTESPDGPPVYSESHRLETNAIGVADLVIGMGIEPEGSFGEINWGSNQHFLKVELDPTGESALRHMGTTQLISVPYAMVSGTVYQPLNKFTVTAKEGHAIDEALFEVTDELGNTLFAVYPEGTRVYVDDSDGKGIKGGFAVGGYKKTKKGETNEYFRVTPDSVRIYIEEPVGKGIKGGFAVGGYKKTNKGVITPHFYVSSDSTEVYVNDPLNGGFNVKLNEAGKGSRNEIMSVSSANSFIGFEAGYGTKTGQDNTFIGTRAGYNNINGANNLYLGFEAGALNMDGNNNIYIGYKAGSNEPGGDNRLFIDNGSDGASGALIYGEFDTEKVRINRSLGIGRDAVEHSLEIEGDAYKTNSDAWVTTSDRRVKTDIKTIENAFEQIMRLRPVTFKYNDSWRAKNPGVDDKTYYNFVAQEFKEVFPESVMESSETLEGEAENIYRMTNQPALIVAIKAVQDLIEENQQQQVLIDELQKENKEMKDLKKRIEKLEEALNDER